MSTRSRAAPWFRRSLTMDQLQLAADVQFGFGLGEEPLGSVLADARIRYANFLGEHSALKDLPLLSAYEMPNVRFTWTLRRCP